MLWSLAEHVPSAQVDTLDMVEEGDKVAVPWIFSGKKDGSPVHLSAVAIYRFEGERHCHVNLSRTECGWGSSCSGDYATFRVQVSSDIDGVGPDFAIGTGCQLMSAGTEVAVNEGVSGEKVLGLPRRFEPLHLPLSSSSGSM